MSDPRQPDHASLLKRALITIDQLEAKLLPEADTVSTITRSGSGAADLAGATAAAGDQRRADPRPS